MEKHTYNNNVFKNMKIVNYALQFISEKKFK